MSLIRVECPFLNGDTNFQCHPNRALPAARRDIGLDGLTLAEVKDALCQSPNDRTICPAFKDLQVVGRTSQFAKPK